MPKELRGHLEGKGLRILIVVARFNESVTSKLLVGAIEGLTAHGVLDSDITVVWVPGAFEIPFIAESMARTHHAVVCLGAVIRHETDHYRYVAEETARGIAKLARKSGVPAIFGVLTTDSIQQAIERAGGKEGNKGYDVALAAIEMANLLAMQQTAT
ncbi:6,7-dimethyl-8-ribityllumazine synthase [Dehalococcoidia bacterium]|nr:6,7-dimethyl-8-ribityllumazine synthase [Dehalococcoidia bacterium]